MSCVFLFGGSLYVSAFVHYPYYWCIRYKRVPCAVNIFHLLFRTARHFSETESGVQVKRMEGTCPLLPLRHSVTKLRRHSSGIKKKLICGEYWYTHTDSMTSSGACFMFLRKQSVADTWCILWQACFEVKDPRSISVYTSFFLCVFEHRHAVKYTSFWLHLIMKLII